MVPVTALAGWTRRMLRLPFLDRCTSSVQSELFSLAPQATYALSLIADMFGPEGPSPTLTRF
jgi:hypothetical protein